MTPEDLKSARIIEAKRLFNWNDPRSVVEILADLYEANWTPPEPVDPDLFAAREWHGARWPGEKESVAAGKQDGCFTMEAYLAGCTRGREGAKGLAEALEAMVDEQCDYMRLNVLGDPEVQHNIKHARAALASVHPAGHRSAAGN